LADAFDPLEVPAISERDHASHHGHADVGLEDGGVADELSTAVANPKNGCPGRDGCPGSGVDAVEQT